MVAAVVNMTEAMNSDNDDSPPATPTEKHGESANCDPSATDNLLEMGAKANITSKKNKKLLLKKQKSSIPNYYGPGGEPLPNNILENVTQFRRKQPKGLIDVWWLYDDGGMVHCKLWEFQYLELIHLREKFILT